jgi:hypothetical protein
MAQGNGKSGGDVTQIREVAQVVDFEDVKQARMEEKRRKTERIFFKNLLSVYCVVGTSHMRPIEIIDVSEDGCSFQVPFDGRQPGFQNAEELTLRLYFSQDTYVPCIFRIQNARSAIVDGKRFHRYGCSVDKTVQSYPAYQQFVRFLEAYGEHAHRDKGDVSVFYL